MPTLELIKWNDSPDIDQILKKDGLNMTELRTYLDPTIIVAFRHKNYTGLPGKIKRVIYPMRECKAQDFTDCGYKVTPLFTKKLKYRLCPDIP